MTDLDRSNIEVFHIDARGGQSWGIVDASVTDGRLYLEIDGGIGEAAGVDLTRIQTEEFSKWLVARLGRE